MSHSYSGRYSELTLEPMEIADKKKTLFGDFSCRDRKALGKVTKSGRACRAVFNRQQQASAGSARKKPAGKANFLTDDRRSPDRRKASRRNTVRLTGDRRADENRRAKTDPWDQEFRA